MWTDTHLFSCCTATETPNINYSSCERTHTCSLLCTATETPNINYSSCERTHTCSAAVYGHKTPNINYSSCERTHTFAAVYGHRDSSYQLQLMWTDTHLFSCCVRPQRLLISTTAHVNGHTLVQLLCTATETPISTTAHVNGHTLVRLLCTATETPNINYSSCERTHTCSAAVYGHRDS